MAITNGPNLNSVPAPQQQALSTNYLDLAATANEGWAQQYVPDLMEREAEVFGPRTISGFLSQVGAEEAMTTLLEVQTLVLLLQLKLQLKMILMVLQVLLLLTTVYE